QGFGWGDAKFAPFIGLILGPLYTIASGWIGVVSGAIVGLILAYLIKREKPKAKSPLANLRIPYVPFMTFGAWCALLWGNIVVDYFINMWKF
ncbi:MAG: hypothetical protein ABIC57_03010, partial [bacterium]